MLRQLEAQATIQHFPSRSRRLVCSIELGGGELFRMLERLYIKRESTSWVHSGPLMERAACCVGTGNYSGNLLFQDGHNVSVLSTTRRS